MLVVAIAAGLGFLVVGTAVGVRMLRLARRTGSLPERLLGAGLCSLTFVTLPCIFLGLGLRVGPLWLQQGLYVAGLVPVVGFAMCIYGFTACVFRSGSRLARALVVASGGLSALGVAGTAWSRIAVWEADRVVGGPWNPILIGTFALGLLWTGAESLRYHRMLRRRLRLGLVDPVVCNRFGLWALGNLVAVAGVLVILASLEIGWRVVTHPVPILGITGAGLALAGSWYLAFLPPEAYLRRVRVRAPAA